MSLLVRKPIAAFASIILAAAFFPTIVGESMAPAQVRGSIIPIVEIG